MAAPKRKHKMGKRTGYDYDVEGGKYYLAPTYVDQFQSIREEEAAISRLVQMVNNHLQDDLAKLQKRSHAIWIEIAEDLGLKENARGYVYDYYTRCVYKPAETPATPPAPNKSEKKP